VTGAVPAAAVVLAAGKGTRMKSDLAKVLFRLAGRPLIRHVLDAVRDAGLVRTVVVVGHQAASVREAAGTGPEFVVQEPQLGTGHAVLCAMPALRDFTGAVVVLAGDVPLIRSRTLRRLADRHRETGALVTVLTALVPDPTGYGRIVRGAGGGVTAIVEHKDATPAQREIREINSGIFAFSRPFLDRSLPRLGNENRQGEYYLTDTVGMAVAEGGPVEGVRIEDPAEIEGVNTPEQLATMESRVAGWADD